MHLNHRAPLSVVFLFVLFFVYVHCYRYMHSAFGMTQLSPLQRKQVCLERRIGKRFLPMHAIMSWLAHCAVVVLRYQPRGDDGKMPYERIRPIPFNSRLVGCGERFNEIKGTHRRRACEFYACQVAHGRDFLRENPAQAISWGTVELKRIMESESAGRATGY